MTHAQQKKTGQTSKEKTTAPEPSWFLDPGTAADNDTMPHRIRRARTSQSDDGQALSFRELVTARHEPDDWFAAADQRSANRQKPKSGRAKADGLSLPRTYALAALAAILAGGGAGYGASQFSLLGQPVVSLKTSETVPVLAIAQPKPLAATTTHISKKPVAIASLNVMDASGAANAQIPLLLSAEPAFPGQDLILKISGVPDSAYLTAGRKAQDKSWELTPEQAETLKIVASGVAEKPIALAIAGFEATSGELITPIKEMTVTIAGAPAVIVPVSAPAGAALPTAIPTPINVSQLLAAGDVHLNGGDFDAARQAYQQAYSMGSAKAALRLGKTFDPFVTEGIGSDRSNALLWYGRALAAGEPGAQDLISRINIRNR